MHIDDRLSLAVIFAILQVCLMTTNYEENYRLGLACWTKMG